MSYARFSRLAGETSRHASTHALLNCIVKEVAIPHDAMSYRWPARREGLSEHLHGTPLLIEWSASLSLFVMVDRRSVIGSHFYLSDVYIRDAGATGWHVPELAGLISSLLEHCRWHDGTLNQELCDQVVQSQDVMTTIVAHAVEHPRLHPLTDYRRSEQGLWFGHPNHPTPKARQWPPHLLQDKPAYAPEFGATAALHQFSFPVAGLSVQANRLSALDVLPHVADQSSAEDVDRVVLSMHPVQADLFRQDTRVAEMIGDGIIGDLGPSGWHAAPTASMRTWYIDGHPWFIKGSLNVRITNCVRKNAWYELESTLVIDRIMHQLAQSKDAALEALCVAQEPATVHWAPTEGDDAVKRWFREQTGVILRENFCQRFSPECCLLSATLFARDAQLAPMVLSLVEGASPAGGCHALPSERRVRQWFQAYLRTLVAPVMGLFFRHGIVMEPHLQNCVLIHDAGMPRQMLLRDFEGIKLTSDKGVDWLMGESLHPRVRESMTYRREQGWNRIAYCLLVNHVAEAILALSWQRPALGDALWQDTRDELHRVRQALGTQAPELDVLLEGGDLPCKTNFKLRLMAQADRQAQYVSLPNPWHVAQAMGREVAYG
ncbi:IucA/IucC family protein [Halomonas heilongjiangensis]|uniref:AcsD protein n=1 Tax=Halomonas heilongjiangensis TaxID=1387883 RepID=A0A2N7THD7_9GAMM|nr:IucA/IucC family protein [Halomonas heilongjiangensis]PMR67583.1 AcsD protein [Halomonas heilongjiangensis]PXX86776.1 AcsD protein [Halomonas heilongjiangensis]